MVHIIQKKIPAFMRIDKDIKRKRDELADFHNQYMDYDIEKNMD